MIKCLLMSLGRARPENIWPSVMERGPRCARSVCHDLGPNVFPSYLPNNYIFSDVTMIEYFLIFLACFTRENIQAVLKLVLVPIAQMGTGLKFLKKLSRCVGCESETNLVNSIVWFLLPSLHCRSEGRGLPFFGRSVLIILESSNISLIYLG